MSEILYKTILPKVKIELQEEKLTASFSDVVVHYQQAVAPEKLKMVIERSVRWGSVWKNLHRPYRIYYQLNAKGYGTGNMKVLFPNEEERYYYETWREDIKRK